MVNLNAVCAFVKTLFINFFCNQIVRCHRQDRNFVVNCSVGACSFVTNSWPAYKMHFARKHKTKNTGLAAPGDLLTAADIQNTSYLTTDSFDLGSNDQIDTYHPQQIMLSASYLMLLECEHKLTQKAINDVVPTTEDLLQQQVSCCKQQIQHKYEQLGTESNAEIINSMKSDGFLKGLKQHTSAETSIENTVI